MSCFYANESNKTQIKELINNLNSLLRSKKAHINFETNELYLNGNYAGKLEDNSESISLYSHGEYGHGADVVICESKKEMI